MSRRLRFTVILLPEGDGIYSVICPAIPGCASQGDGREDALANIQEAMMGLLLLRQKKGWPLPVETPDIVADEIRACLHDRAEEKQPLTLETRQVEVEVEVPV